MAQALPIAFLDGEFLPLAAARISPLDRGFLFGDAVYEVIGAYDGVPLLLEAHLARLARSLAELRIAAPCDDAGWRRIIAGLIERNGGGRAHPDLGLYLQVSRGADAGRDHCFPQGVCPTVFAMASALAPTRLDAPGLRAITAPDNRWGRCDIKSTALLANVLLRQAAADAGAGECIMLRDGFVTEGSGSSVLVLEGRCLVSRPNGPDIHHCAGAGTGCGGRPRLARGSRQRGPAAQRRRSVADRGAARAGGRDPCGRPAHCRRCPRAHVARGGGGL